MTKDGITPLEESIHILNMLNNDIQRFYSALYELPNYNVPDEILTPLNTLTFSHGCISIINYFDEYDKHFMPLLTSEQKQQVIPYYKRIKKVINLYPDIRAFRNQAVAHNLRVKNNGIPLNKRLGDFKIPQNGVEYNLVRESIQILTKIINQLFPLAMKKVVSYLATNRANLEVYHTPPLTPTEGNKILEVLIRDVNAINK